MSAPALFAVEKEIEYLKKALKQKRSIQNLVLFHILRDINPELFQRISEDLYIHNLAIAENSDNIVLKITYTDDSFDDDDDAEEMELAIDFDVIFKYEFIYSIADDLERLKDNLKKLDDVKRKLQWNKNSGSLIHRIRVLKERKAKTDDIACELISLKRSKDQLDGLLENQNLANSKTLLEKMRSDIVEKMNDTEDNLQSLRSNIRQKAEKIADRIVKCDNQVLEQQINDLQREIDLQTSVLQIDTSLLKIYSNMLTYFKDQNEF